MNTFKSENKLKLSAQKGFQPWTSKANLEESCESKGLWNTPVFHWFLLFALLHLVCPESTKFSLYIHKGICHWKLFTQFFLAIQKFTKCFALEIFEIHSKKAENLPIGFWSCIHHFPLHACFRSEIWTNEVLKTGLLAGVNRPKENAAGLKILTAHPKFLPASGMLLAWVIFWWFFEGCCCETVPWKNREHLTVPSSWCSLDGALTPKHLQIVDPWKKISTISFLF